MRIVAKDQGWGFHQRAELLNGRLAMLGFAIGVVLELAAGPGILEKIELRALLHHSRPRLMPTFHHVIAESSDRAEPLIR